MRSNGRLLECMVQLCFDENKWDLLSDTAHALAKKRSLIKSVRTSSLSAHVSRYSRSVKWFVYAAHLLSVRPTSRRD
jgi:hypothetical protein